MMFWYTIKSNFVQYVGFINPKRCTKISNFRYLILRAYVYGQHTFTYWCLVGVIMEWAVKETVISLEISYKVYLESEAIADLLIIDRIQRGYRNHKDNQLHSLELPCRIL